MTSRLIGKAAVCVALASVGVGLLLAGRRNAPVPISRASRGVPWPYTSSPVGSASGPSWNATATHPQWTAVATRVTFDASVQP